MEGGNPILFSLKFVESGVCSRGHGCCFLDINLSCLVSMVRQLVMDSSSHEGTEAGLRGFRKRWREAASIAPVANSEAHISEVDGADAIPLDSELEDVNSPLGSNFGSENYAPSIQPQVSHESGSVQVAATGSSEFGWKCEAFKSAVKRTRLYGDSFAWEQPGFGGVFQKPDLFSGTIGAMLVTLHLDQVDFRQWRS